MLNDIPRAIAKYAFELEKQLLKIIELLADIRDELYQHNAREEARDRSAQ